MASSEKKVERKLVAKIIKQKPDSIDASDLVYFVLQVGDCVHSVVGIFPAEKEAVAFAVRTKKKNDGHDAFFVKGRESYLSQHNISVMEICWEADE